MLKRMLKEIKSVRLVVSDTISGIGNKLIKDYKSGYRSGSRQVLIWRIRFGIWFRIGVKRVESEARRWPIAVPVVWLGVLLIGGGLGFSMIIAGAELPQVEAVPEIRLSPSVTPTPTSVPLPIARGELLAPELTLRGALVMDKRSGVILFAKNPDERLMPASTTKIMTALTALDLFHPEEVVTVSNEAFAIGRSFNLEEGQQYTVSELVRAVLIGSGNDAALALAQHHQQGYEGFVAHMNYVARTMGLERTAFVNVSGVESEAHLTTARDLAQLTLTALDEPLIAESVGMKEVEIKDITGVVKTQLVNTNDLLGEVEGVMGVKTGWTPRAGECLVTYVDRSEAELIVVVLGSQDRFGESRTLIEWAYDNFEWQE